MHYYLSIKHYVLLSTLHSPQYPRYAENEVCGATAKCICENIKEPHWCANQWNTGFDYCMWMQCRRIGKHWQEHTGNLPVESGPYAHRLEAPTCQTTVTYFWTLGNSTSDPNRGQTLCASANWKFQYFWLFSSQNSFSTRLNACKCPCI